MPNQLAIPFKKTYDIEIEEAVCNFLQEHNGSHPNAFKWDINRWKDLRRDGVGGVVHVTRIPATLCYHAQLLSIIRKFPTDIGLEIPYASAFFPSELPITLKNLAFERAAVLFNLAALYSQLAISEDRSNRDGIKRAIAHYQNAAGTLSFLISSALPKLFLIPDDEEIPLDLTESFVKSLEWLMLAQAQECVWQRAVMESYKNGLIAKLAASVVSLYALSISAINEASPSIKHKFPSHWLSHLETKRHHFQAAAQFRKSIDEIEGNRYGLELARLAQAQIDAKKGYNFARRSGVAHAVLQDIQSLLDTVQKNYTRCQRDNDLIYHQEIPAASTLAPIPETPMVRSIVPQGLGNPKGAIGEDSLIFAEVLAWGTREAINIFMENKKNLIKEKIIDVAHDLDNKANETLRSLNLPSSLEMLEKPVGLPPSLLRKAEEVRLEDGPSRIEASIEDVQTLARQDMKILDEAMDILDNEASEDETFYKDAHIVRQRSHEANQDMVSKERRYRDTLEQAAASDELVRQKWEQWEMSIRELTWDQTRLTESVPSSTVPRSGLSPSNATQTQTHARALRILLESLGDLRQSRTQLTDRAQRLAELDDIQPRILKAAAGLEQLAEVQPVMFEDISDEELAKYDRFIHDISENEQKQTDVLVAIQARNEMFLQSRRDEPSVKMREHALQSLDLAYHKYREITRNLDEGLKFYNDFAVIVMEFKETCRSWSNSRKKELHSLSRFLHSMSLGDFHNEQPTKHGRNPSSPLQVRAEPSSPSYDLPSLHSDEWETMELPPGPPHSTKSSPWPSKQRLG